MTSLKRPLAAAGASVLLALSLTACGGAPTDASVADFCKVTQNSESQDAFAKAFADEDYDKIEDLIKEQADAIEEVGTPEDISDEEREGFEIQIDAIKGLSADDLKEAFESEDEEAFEGDLSDDDKKKVEAYEAYESKTCADADTGTGDDDPASDGESSTEE